MKTLQVTLLWFLLMPWVKPAPPIPQSTKTEIFKEVWDDEEPLQDGKAMKKKDTAILHDESAMEQPAKQEDGEMPTCLLCVCLSGSVYCEETDIDAVPPLPKETSYLYARFNKIKKIMAKDFAEIRLPSLLLTLLFSSPQLHQFSERAKKQALGPNEHTLQRWRFSGRKGQ